MVTLRRFSIVAVAVLTLLALSATSALAVSNAHFVGSPTATRSDNTLTVAGKVAGLGNVDTIFVEVSGNVLCVNPGSKHPKAANKEAFDFSGDFPVQNGKALFSFTIDGSQIDPNCSPPMTLVFTDVVVHVTAADGTDLTFRFSGTF
jgi:hypothetical protein